MAVQILKPMTLKSETFFIPVWPIKSTQELTIYIATLVTIDVPNRQPPCGMSSPTLGSSVSDAGVLSLSVDVLRLYCVFSCED